MPKTDSDGPTAVELKEMSEEIPNLVEKLKVIGFLSDSQSMNDVIYQLAVKLFQESLLHSMSVIYLLLALSLSLSVGL